MSANTGLAASGQARLQPPGSHLIKFSFAEQLPFAVRGEGVFVYDAAGHRYLDGCSGAVTVNLGHSDPEILARIRQQASALTFAHRGAFHNQPAEQLADRLAQLTGYPYVFFCNSGSEAVEAALKLVLQSWQERGHPNRFRFASHAIGYHGSTLGGLSLSGHPLRRLPAQQLLHDFNVLTPPYAYRYAAGRDATVFTADLLDNAAAAFDTMHAELAGVVVEPIGGAAGGAITPPAGYLDGLAQHCQARGVPFIADEVMTGLGRTGRILAVDHYGVQPDVVVLGKGLGAGYTPISAVLVNAPIIEAIANGTAAVANGHTYGGNPLSCATALAVLDVLTARDLINAARERGSELRDGLDLLAQRHPIIGEVRGLGLLQGLELVTDPVGRQSSQPIGRLTHALVKAARQHGLLLYPATGGVNDAVLIAPPLTSTTDEIDLLLSLLDTALRDVERDPDRCASRTN